MNSFSHLVLNLNQSLEDESSKLTAEHISKHHDKHETALQGGIVGGRIIKNTRYAPPRLVNFKNFIIIPQI